jgi:hypothetical protein
MLLQRPRYEQSARRWARNEKENPMRFMMFMYPGPRAEVPGAMPDPKMIEQMMKYNEELQKAGALLALDGLHPSSKGARVSFAGGTPKVNEGPFGNPDAIVGGYWVIQAKSKDEAIAWAKRVPAEPDNIIEVRQVFDPADFEGHASNEVIAREKALGEKLKSAG